MSNKSNKGVALSKDAVVLIRGIITGKVLTLLVVGGVLWWLATCLRRDNWDENRRVRGELEAAS